VLAALGLVALLDVTRRGRSATRHREYAFWISCAIVGAVFGAATDAMTSRISVDYFVLGKGLDGDSARFAQEVLALGASAGSSAGFVVGGALLIANNPRRDVPQLEYGALLRLLIAPILGALTMALLLDAFSNWDVQGLGPELRRILAERDVRRFLRVQRLHAGLYLGGVGGTVLAFRAVSSRRRQQPRAHAGSA